MAHAVVERPDAPGVSGLKPRFGFGRFTAVHFTGAKNRHLVCHQNTTLVSQVAGDVKMSRRRGIEGETECTGLTAGSIDVVAAAQHPVGFSGREFYAPDIATACKHI